MSSTVICRSLRSWKEYEVNWKRKVAKQPVMPNGQKQPALIRRHCDNDCSLVGIAEIN